MTATIFFNGTAGFADTQLYVSDGTAAGTHAVIVPNEPPYQQFYPYGLTPYMGKIYFVSIGLDDELYVSDGTVAGTLPVLGADSAPFYGANLIVESGDGLFFTTLTNNSQTLSLYVSIDGATPTLVPHANMFDIEYSLTPYKGGVVFYGSSGIYFSDGYSVTPLLTTPPAPVDLTGYTVYGPPVVPVVFGNNRLLVSYLNGFDIDLAVSDGTSIGTKPLYIPNVAQYGTQTSLAFAWGNRVVFDAELANNKDDIFVSNGTTGGTQDLSSVLAGFATSFESGMVFLGKLLLAGVNAAGHGVLLLTDGTAAGTAVLATSSGVGENFHLASSVFSSMGFFAPPPSAVVVGDTVYFAGPPGNGTDLWKSDGTAAGTTALGLAGIDPVFLASLNPAHTLYGDLGGRSTIQGTIENDYITAYGTSNVIDGNGGSDTIFGGAGGYNQVYEGTPGDNATGSTAITLQGRGNTVLGGDENFSISGGSGTTGVTLGNGDNTVSLGGSYNTVAAGIGNNVIDAGGGYSKVVIAGPSIESGPTDTITFAGQHNQLLYEIPADPSNLFAQSTIDVTGGSGYGNFDIGSSSGTITTDGLYNTISFDLINQFNANYVTPGSGYDTVDLGHAQSASLNMPLDNSYNITLAGTHNTVTGEANIATVVGGSGDGNFVFDFESDIGASGGVFPTDFYVVTTGGSYNAFSLLMSNQNSIVTGSDHATVSIQTPVLTDPSVQIPPFTSFITFAGTGNSLTDTDAPVVATGGDGGSTYKLGNGDNSITTGGTLNFISLGTGTSTVAPGSGYDTLVLNGSNAVAQLQGAADKVFLNAGASGTIEGTGLADLHVYVAPGIGAETINGILSDPRAIIDLMGDAGGYTTAQAAYAALTPDGSGGSRLAIGAGAIDFAGAPKASLSSHMFAIG